MVQKCEVHPTEEAETVQSSENFYEPSDRIQQISASINPKHKVSSLFQESPSDTYSLTSWLRDYMMKFGSSLRNQSHLPLIIVIIVAVVFIMQVFTPFNILSNIDSHIGICNYMPNDELPRSCFPLEFLL